MEQEQKRGKGEVIGAFVLAVIERQAPPKKLCMQPYESSFACIAKLCTRVIWQRPRCQDR
eukprot:1154088-Pelagomonas_calceolata.AAC.3